MLMNERRFNLSDPVNVVSSETIAGVNTCLIEVRTRTSRMLKFYFKNLQF